MRNKRKKCGEVSNGKIGTYTIELEEGLKIALEAMARCFETARKGMQVHDQRADQVVTVNIRREIRVDLK